MRTKCVICGKAYTEKSINKEYPYIPQVCSMNCFLALLKQDKAINSDRLTEALRNNPIDTTTGMSQVTYRSSFERLFADKLKEKGIRFLYEPFLVLGKYIPDFYLQDYYCFVEIKGIWESGAYDKVVEAIKAGFPLYLIMTKNIARFLK